MCPITPLLPASASTPLRLEGFSPAVHDEVTAYCQDQLSTLQTMTRQYSVLALVRLATVAADEAVLAPAAPEPGSAETPPVPLRPRLPTHQVHCCPCAVVRVGQFGRY